MRGRRSKRAGFSLMDCLIALALLGVVISIAIPLTMQYLNRSHTAACLAQIAEIEKIFPRFRKEDPATPLASLAQLASPKYLGRPLECPHGGTYALIQPEQTGENNARVVCSLHFWPARGKTAVVDAALAGGWDMNEGRGTAIGGGANQGVIHGARWVMGRSGTALNFSTHEAEAGALGTFNHLDGEMVMLDGKVYQFSADGFTHDVEDGVKTPFVCVTNFIPDTVEDIEGEFDDTTFNQLLESMIPSNNMFYAIRIDGFFNHVKVWSVRKQEDNTPLSAVADAQPEFEYDDIEGTLAGFYSPRFIKSLNMPGFHLHFLTADRRRGGHLHGCNLKRATIGIQHVPRLIMDLPLTLDYLTADLKR